MFGLVHRVSWLAMTVCAAALAAPAGVAAAPGPDRPGEPVGLHAGAVEASVDDSRGPGSLAPEAELWGFVDAEGVAHFADHAVDGRYQRVFGPDEGRPAPRRVPGKKDSPDALLMRMSIAPEARALRPWLREASERHGVDDALMLALIAVESGFDAGAVSPAGAIGLMQIMPVSGERYARGKERLRPVEQRLLDPRTNILTGARMLGDLLRRFGRLDLALAAWNAGEGHVRRHGNRIPPFAETRAHVAFVLELYESLRRQREQSGTNLGLRLVGRR